MSTHDDWIENLGHLRAWVKKMEMFVDETPIYPPGKDESLQFRLILDVDKGTRCVIGRCCDVDKVR